jgi:hypothetical protein
MEMEESIITLQHEYQVLGVFITFKFESNNTPTVATGDNMSTERILCPILMLSKDVQGTHWRLFASIAF